MISCKFQDTKTQQKSLAGMRRRASNIIIDTDHHVRFVFLKAIKDGNGSPAMTLREAIPSMPRVTGFSRKALDEFMLKYTGFAWDKAKKVYKKDRSVHALIESLPAKEKQEQHCRFWEFENTEKVKAEPVEQVREYLSKRVQKVSKDDLLAIIESLYSEDQKIAA